MDTYRVFFDTISPSFTNLLKFILIQDPVKIAVGMALGLNANKLLTEVVGGVVSPLVGGFIKLFSETGFNYNFGGMDFNFGNILQQIILFAIFLIVLFFGFVGPIDKLRKKYNIEQKSVGCPYCTTLISPFATRCPSCTSEIKPKE
jgi:large conductance mechanosensitive channel